MTHYDLFEVIAHEDHEGKVALRKATAVATKRVSEQFGQFLAAATSFEQYLNRLDFIDSDLQNTVKAAAEEYGVDAEPVLAGIRAHLKKTPEPRTASTERESRRPKLCPYHSEVTDISLAQGEPRAGFDAMAQHAWGPQHCQGSEYDGGRCNFKRDMTTQAYWDEKAQQQQERREQREQERAQQAELEAQEPVVDDVEHDPAQVEEPVVETDGEIFEPAAEVTELPVAEEPQAAEPMAMAAATDQDAPLARSADLVKEAPGGQHSEAWGESGSKRNRQYEHIKSTCLESGKSEEECKELAARTVNKTRSEHGETKDSKTAEALETVDVTKGGEDPSPKMDKDKWVPENLKVVDTEGEGSPHPTVRKDVTEPIERSNDSDPFEETDAVVEHQDVEKDTSIGPGETGQWTKNKGANPVSSAVDPSVNPVREVLLGQDDDGFPEETEILSAISHAH